MTQETNERTDLNILPCENLCFRPACFQENDFQVDKFVAESKNRVPLHLFREDLETHYKYIRIALIDLINKDYTDFVNLSSNLVGMDKNLQNLRQPLRQLWKKVGLIKIKLGNALNATEEKLIHRRQTKEIKAQLHHLLNVTNYVDKIEKVLFSDCDSKEMAMFTEGFSESHGQFLERIAGDFNQLQFHVNQCKGHRVVNLISPRVSLITSKLQESLEASFYEGLVSFQPELVLRCLRTYALIDKIDHAENLVRHDFVGPKFSNFISQDVYEAKGLKEICDSVIHFTKSDCYLLLKYTSGVNCGKENEVKGFDFMVNSVWPEVDLAFETRLSFIFSPGNPAIFFERYQIVTKFLEQFEVVCGSMESLKRLRAHPSYQSFIGKWSLPVYFQIRFQEICCNVEAAIDKPTEIPKDASMCFSTNVVDAIWRAVDECWDEKIFIQPLASRFWKLSLQILSRLALFLADVVKSFDGHDVLGVLKVKYEPSFIARLFGDISKVEYKVKTIFLNRIKPILQRTANDLRHHEDVFGDSLHSFVKYSDQLSEYCVNCLTEACTQPLEQTKNIPRLYRRTNKEQPMQPSEFIISAFLPLKDFKASIGHSIKPEMVFDISERTVLTAVNRYHIVVDELVTSIKKTEDSLQRLRRLRKGGESSALLKTASDMSDEIKIRKQLLLDVEKFGQEAEKVVKKPMALIKEYKDLLKLVQTSSDPAL